MTEQCFDWVVHCCSCDQEQEGSMGLPEDTSARKHEQHVLSALMAVLWHSDAAEGIVQPTAVMAIGQWCETKMQAMHFQANASAEHEGILKSILPILGAISSSLLKPNVVATFLSTNEALLQELMQNKKSALETCSLVLLSLRRYCQADQKHRALQFRFFQVVFIEAGCAVVLQAIRDDVHLYMAGLAGQPHSAATRFASPRGHCCNFGCHTAVHHGLCLGIT